MAMETDLDAPLHTVLKRMQKRIMDKTHYFGVKTLKNPLDFWVYQEIIFDHQPDVIVEIGNNWGGSTLALAHTLDLVGVGRVLAVDISHDRIHETVRQHSRITLIEAPAMDAFPRVQELISTGEKVLVIEDSAHTFENTLGVLRLYSELIQPGDYFIVEDTICHHGLNVGPSPGPYEAVEAFMEETGEFEVDREKESFFITWNPKGFLRRKR